MGPDRHARTVAATRSCCGRSLIRSSSPDWTIAHPTRATLEKWADVQGTAENMADYPTKDEKTGIYHLAFVMPPSERGTTSDTVFDLAY